MGLPSFITPIMGKSQPLLLLDAVTTATGGWSLRKLRAAYSGNCIRVRRSSDNTEQDIGFVGNVLDSSSLTTFVGANNGFVVTWYDQSGVGRNLTQTTATAQPLIVSSGTIVTEGTKSAVSFNGTTQFMNVAATLPTYPLLTTSHSLHLVGKSTLTGGASAGFINYRSTTPTDRPELRYGALLGTSSLLYWNAGYAVNTLSGITTYSLHSAYYTPVSGVTVNGYRNGSSIFSGNRADNWSSSAAPIFQIGYYSVALAYRGGVMQEMIIWNTDKTSNRTTIDSNVNSYYAIW
jgi:hypothetical protein